jgi:AcrR family transcriptional regulator
LVDPAPANRTQGAHPPRDARRSQPPAYNRRMAEASGKARILDAAVGILRRGGIGDLTVARVSTEAGVSPALVHYHFTSTEELLAAALELSFEVSADMWTSPGQDSDDPLQRLAAKLEENLPTPGRYRHEWEIWLELSFQATRDARLRASTTRVYERLHTAMHSALAAIVEAGIGRCADLHAATDRVLAAIDGFGIRAMLDPTHLDVDRMRAEIMLVVAHELELPVELWPPR